MFQMSKHETEEKTDKTAKPMTDEETEGVVGGTTQGRRDPNRPWSADRDRRAPSWSGGHEGSGR